MKKKLALFVLCSTIAACSGTDASNTPNQGDVVKLGKLSGKAPASWKEEKPSSTMRLSQFRLPKAEGDAEDAELAIFFFESGGSVQDNIDRWKGMFTAPEGKSIDQVTKVEKFQVAGINTTYSDIHGTFAFKDMNKQNSKVQKKANYRHIGVILESPEGQYVLRLSGPASTIEAHKKGFDDWLKNLK
ncbi:MAG TPA: hypothetical protein VE988_08195 [Gemmataceae bacterium]|nr:hypothetical protein [Gemmataceae bacterium]